MASVAVIDIGSNSIKVLVASKDGAGRYAATRMRTIEARISAGISREDPRLSEEGMDRGLAAVLDLWAEAKSLKPDRTIVVATSAVRGARNGADFCERVRLATGLTVQILSGDEEANLIGRGLLCDPTLASLRDFQVFDLGGGSLECLVFRDRSIERAVSLPLGCVRLTERFVSDPSLPFGAARAVEAFVKASLEASGFPKSPGVVAIGTGGTLTTVRAILGARAGLSLAEAPADLSVSQLSQVLFQVGALPLSDRKKIDGLPSGRADVFPAALATLIAVAEFGGFESYRHSLYNLRWGIAAQTLD